MLEESSVSSSERKLENEHADITTQKTLAPISSRNLKSLVQEHWYFHNVQYDVLQTYRVMPAVALLRT